MAYVPLDADFLKRLEKIAEEKVPKRDAAVDALVDELAEIKRQIEALKEKETDISERLLEEMENRDLKLYYTKSATVNYIKPNNTKKFDSIKFKHEHPELYPQYVSEIERSAYLRVKVKETEREAYV